MTPNGFGPLPLKRDLNGGISGSGKASVNPTATELMHHGLPSMRQIGSKPYSNIVTSASGGGGGNRLVRNISRSQVDSGPGVSNSGASGI